MIYLAQPFIKTENKKVRLICNIKINQIINKQVYFEVAEQYGKYLCFERCDAFIIGILNYAMRNNLDIVSEAPITRELLFNINEYLIPSLVKYDDNLHHINITAPLTDNKIRLTNGVGTGLSCGIDSFYAIINNFQNSTAPKLTHLCINNVGAFNACYKEFGIEKVKKERYEQAIEVANKLGLPVILTDSNFMTEFEQNHSLTHTYSSIFAVYCLQKLWRVYFYGSSGYDFSNFSINNSSKKDCSLYELLSLNCFSTSSLRIYSDGGAKNRFEKTKKITNSKIAQEHLHVCIKESKNCGKCSKCMRTLLTLDALGILDNFKKVFDIEYYKQNKSMYFKYLVNSHLKSDKMNEATYQQLKNQIPFKIKFSCRLKKLGNDIFAIENSSDKKYKIIKLFSAKLKLKRKSPQPLSRK